MTSPPPLQPRGQNSDFGGSSEISTQLWYLHCAWPVVPVHGCVVLHPFVVIVGTNSWELDKFKEAERKKVQKSHFPVTANARSDCPPQL